MSQVQMLSLFLALSVALNLACCAGWAARLAGNGRAQAALVAGGTACTVLTVFFAGVSAFR
ncbi:hypothetical protein OG782_34455 [Streptomyces sp. NBC_00876]|uniref:hypothetical protein n=1 Tax=Streptomyces sp. NBC_00876 TaxID=2975853 RepID=UPI003864F845|nr:hypothetical protein OG782_34455 [Streptomyces sp. NBC_00876]